MQAADFLGDEETVRQLCPALAQKLLVCDQDDTFNQHSSIKSKRRRAKGQDVSQEADMPTEEPMTPGQVRCPVPRIRAYSSPSRPDSKYLRSMSVCYTLRKRTW